MSRLPLGLALVLTLSACTSPGKGVIALEGATLIDGSGGPPVKDALILIRGGRIEAVSRVNEIHVPRGAQRISLIGKTIIPGLIDAQARAERWAMPRFVAWGVTTLRDAGDAPEDTLIALRNDLSLGTILGPRMYTSGSAIDAAPAGLTGWVAAATPEEARKAVDARVNAGVDYIMAEPGVPPTMLRSILDEASVLHTLVALTPGRVDAAAAAHAGVVALEQLTGVVSAMAHNPAPIMKAYGQRWAGWAAEEKGWSTFDSNAVASMARTLAGAHVSLVPTLVSHEAMARLNDPSLLAGSGWSDVPAGRGSVRGIADFLRETGWSARDMSAFVSARTRQNQFVRDYRLAGGLVAAGSDAPSPGLAPGGSLHREMALLVAAGFSPLEAITAATRYGAELLQADSLGVVQSGHLADLVVLNSDPSQHIESTQDIAWVMLRGNIYHPDSLRLQWAHEH
ncbi:MAG TPA: amidohydrolase family protein [Gemmatimonadales bacterium]|nr:amidohydrolase family protein [Gemmatimonadales bacterium]